jgi:hypothetical protein
VKRPPTPFEIAANRPAVSGADGKAILCWGTIRRRLSFGLCTFFVTFLLAAVYRPILGLDFLSAHGLLVDPVGHQVLDSKTLKPLSLRSKFAAAFCSIAPSVRTLLASFPTIVGDGKGKPSPKNKIRHTVETTCRPVFAKARRLDPDKLRKAGAEFRELKKAGINRRSDSPWSLPLHMVRKKDGSWRPCGHYRQLNLATTHDRYPLPSILDLSNKLHGCKFFSCIVFGYHQIPMAAQDIVKTVIITPFGLFKYLFMPFGLRIAAQTFQGFIDSLFKHLPFLFCYLDDIIIASHSLEEHHEHLRQIYTFLQENGLQINPAKCVFATAAVKFLGHRVDQDVVRPLKRHVQAISDFPPPPQDVKQLQQFLGMVNFYRRFLPGIARTLQPLTGSLKGAPKTLEWPPAAAAAFGSAKAALAAAVPLAHPAPNAVLSLATDASDTTVGGVLQQLNGRTWQPLAFYSKKLSGAGTRYSTFDRELLDAFSAVRHFRFLLEGRQFHLLTDHKPLVTSLFRSTPLWLARQQRQLSFIAEFTSDIRHTPGQENMVADALSRPPPTTAQPPPPSCTRRACFSVPNFHVTRK